MSDMSTGVAVGAFAGAALMAIFFLADNGPKLEAARLRDASVAQEGFVRGVCDGRLSNCDATVRITNEGGVSEFQIHGGLVLQDNGSGKLEAAQLPRSCVGYPDSASGEYQSPHWESCEVVRPEPNTVEGVAISPPN